MDVEKVMERNSSGASEIYLLRRMSDGEEDAPWRRPHDSFTAHLSLRSFLVHHASSHHRNPCYASDGVSVDTKRLIWARRALLL
jgi:hypothetical protein